MARSRRLSAAFLVSLALAALVAAATVAGGGERRVTAEGGMEATVQSQHTEQALTPAKRQSAEQVSFVVVAVLAVLVGMAATGPSAEGLVRRRRALPAARRRTVRLRGPPVLQFS